MNRSDLSKIGGGVGVIVASLSALNLIENQESNSALTLLSAKEKMECTRNVFIDPGKFVGSEVILEANAKMKGAPQIKEMINTLGEARAINYLAGSKLGGTMVTSAYELSIPNSSFVLPMIERRFIGAMQGATPAPLEGSVEVVGEIIQNADGTFELLVNHVPPVKK